MKNLILFFVAALFLSGFSGSLLYNDGISRLEVPAPLANELLVMNSTGNFSTIPDPGRGEAYVIFYDGLVLSYKKVPYPKNGDSSSPSSKVTIGHMEAWLKANGITDANIDVKRSEQDLRMRAWGFGSSTNKTSGASR